LDRKLSEVLLLKFGDELQLSLIERTYKLRLAYICKRHNRHRVFWEKKTIGVSVPWF
jgi:hypothetical protein